MARSGSHSPSPSSLGGSIRGPSSVLSSRTSCLPEQWTLPEEWNIEKRQVHQNWKLDVQNQIAFMDKKLRSSLRQHPEREDFPLEDGYVPSWVNVGDPEVDGPPSSRMVIGQMQLGVRRS